MQCKSAYSHPPSRTWNHWTSPWMKQLTWLRIIHSGEWCLRLALCTHSGAWQKWINQVVQPVVWPLYCLSPGGGLPFSQRAVSETPQCVFNVRFKSVTNLPCCSSTERLCFSCLLAVLFDLFAPCCELTNDRVTQAWCSTLCKLVNMKSM